MGRGGERNTGARHGAEAAGIVRRPVRSIICRRRRRRLLIATGISEEPPGNRRSQMGAVIGTSRAW